MPLRITNEEDESIVAKKKVHRKMSKNGHYQKVRRPTGLEVYTDAARILEELLEKRIDEDVKVGKLTKRNKSDPTRDVIRPPQEEDGAGNAVARSKTMPSRYRESKDEELKRKDQEALRERYNSSQRKRSKEHGSDSSMDTADDDISETGAKRHKKSRFKRAVQRLKYVFNRDQKEGLGKISDKEDSKHSPGSGRKKPKRRISKLFISEEKRHVVAHVDGEDHIKVTEEQGYRDKYCDKHTKVTTVSHGDERPKEALNFTVSQDIDGHRQISASGIKLPSDGHHSLPSSALSKPFNGTAHTGREGSRKSATLPSGGHPTPQSVSVPSRPASLDHRKDSPVSKSSTLSPHKDLVSLLKAGIDTDGHDGTPTTSSNGSDHLASSNHLSSQSNILDSPGEDIKFMDDVSATTTRGRGDEMAASRQGGDSSPAKVPGSSSDNTTSSAHGTPLKFHGSKGLLDMTWLADQIANGAVLQDLELDEQTVTTQRPDGCLEVTTVVEARQTVLLPDVMEEDVDGAVTEDHPRTEAEKEEMYSKVAQRLAEMADSYAYHFSDQEGRGGAVAAAPGPLSDLENEIIACLRSSGDRNSRQFDAAVAEASGASQEEAYQRFRSTVQNSMGRELSWDYLAFLFHTTKSVVSAVGKGSQVASQAKEFTLKYISDTFATWLIDQGGFDSMLSETEETDFELD
ncbi:hypothetical protein PoB_005989300 [Plakobranchus ocellatus]|uniref:Uncharacterized protein n=1 Tax=Plakobranchus ocellatus TaxID=259542 RepID=A0AAV4CNE7_9GAST|nr:hypothetical protein PoB_005989300 [Plakobranchus ocellatus]